MLLSHAVLYAEARSYLSALADGASSLDANLEYERVVLQLDWLHDGQVPPITVVPSGAPDVLFNVAGAAIRGLERHAIDPLDLELCISMLDAAWALDQPL
jgi:hypothetical protein